MSLDQLVYFVVLLLVVGLLFSTLAEKFRLGSIFGLLSAGVALGPYSPGPILTDDVAGLLDMAEVGVVLLMFTIGLEMRPERLWAMRKYLLGLGSAQMVFCGLLLMGALSMVTPLSFSAVLIVGFGLSLSSTAIAMQILAEKGEVATQHGQATFGTLIFQDIAAVPLLVLVPILSATTVADTGANRWNEAGLTLGALVGVFVLGYSLLPRLLRWAARRQSNTSFAALVLIAVLAASMAMEEAGLSMAMGAFVLGVLLSISDYRYQIEVSVLPLKGVFMALFFVAVGMSINIDVAVATGPKLFVYLGIVVSLKIIGVALLARLFGLDWGDSIRTAVLLSQSGEFGFVLFALAASGGLLSDSDFALAVVVISLSMAITPIVVKLGYGIADAMSKNALEESSLRRSEVELTDHVIVAGYNRVGRLLCIMLKKTRIPYIAFDIDVDRVSEGKREGVNVHYGDVTNPVMREAAAFANAKLVVLTLENMENAARLIEYLKSFYPHLSIQMAVPDLVTQNNVRAMGVEDVICTQVEGGLKLGESVLNAAGVADADIDEAVAALRAGDYAEIRILNSVSPS